MDDPILQFFVEGVPVQAGSSSAFPIYTDKPLRKVSGRHHGKYYGNSIVTDTAKNKPWKRAVAWAAKAAVADVAIGLEFPLTFALVVEFTFWMPRPKFHWGTGRNARQFRPSAPHNHSVYPDLDKLVRSTQDAATGIVWKDDALVGGLGGTEKIYTPKPTLSPGVWITVWRKP